MRAPAIVATLLVATALGCAHASGVRLSGTSRLSGALESQMDPHDALPWSAARPLVWSDFQGLSPAGRPDESAQTAYSLFHGATCTGRTFEFKVVAAFLPRQSWVRPAVLASAAQSGRTLRHEQTHFDLSEVHARRMRRYFSELFEPCMKTVEELGTLATRFVREETAAQRKYDEETGHGRVSRKQAEWDTEVNRQLVSLGKFEK